MEWLEDILRKKAKETSTEDDGAAKRLLGGKALVVKKALTELTPSSRSLNFRIKAKGIQLRSRLSLKL